MTAVDDGLRAQLLACWTDVSNAGGSVGFVPPVTPAEVAPYLDAVVERVHLGREVVALLRVDGEVAGFAEAASQLLVEFGVPASDVRVERFGPSG